eukprot:Rmarinus@m.4796
MILWGVGAFIFLFFWLGRTLATSSSTKKSRNGTVLITGPTSGIGFEMARCFAKDGINLVLVSRDKNKLQQLCSDIENEFGVNARYFTVDLSSAGAAEKVFQFTEANGINIDYLVNNAGFGGTGPYYELGCKLHREMVAVNVGALAELTSLYLPHMVQNRWGKVLNISSMASFQPGPRHACYYASKAFVTSLTEALAFELKDSGVSATALCPGPVSTAFADRAGNIHNKLFKLMPITLPEDVAQIGYDAMWAGRTLVFDTTLNRISAMLCSTLPRPIIMRVIEFLESH